jgi:hypothetical protein
LIKQFTKQELIDACKQIHQMGWIQSARHGNQGGIGNTLEDLLGIEENNLPIANASEWELKAQRSKTTALLTLFHMEPSPTAFKFVPQILLPQYGWRHQEAGKKYPENEMSFRQTINARLRSNRGFGVQVDRKDRKIMISFDSQAVATKHFDWLDFVDANIGLGELDPQPYWGFDDLFHKVGTKLHNCFFILADVKREKLQDKTIEYFHYKNLFILKNLDLEHFISAIEAGYIYVDFDARTRHNHGTKFRLPSNRLIDLYGDVEQIF